MQRVAPSGVTFEGWAVAKRLLEPDSDEDDDSDEGMDDGSDSGVSARGAGKGKGKGTGKGRGRPRKDAAGGGPARSTARFSSGSSELFSPQVPSRISPLTPSSTRLVRTRWVASISTEPSGVNCVVAAGYTPVHIGRLNVTKILR